MANVYATIAIDVDMPRFKYGPTWGSCALKFKSRNRFLSARKHTLRPWERTTYPAISVIVYGGGRCVSLHDEVDILKPVPNPRTDQLSLPVALRCLPKWHIVLNEMLCNP